MTELTREEILTRLLEKLRNLQYAEKIIKLPPLKYEIKGKIAGIEDAIELLRRGHNETV